jgi:asparagine synthase (glutamine-hydrolysing)
MFLFFGSIQADQTPQDLELLQNILPRERDAYLLQGDFAYLQASNVTYAKGDDGRQVLFRGRTFALERWRKAPKDPSEAYLSQAELLLKRWQETGDLGKTVDNVIGPYLAVCVDEKGNVLLVRDPLGQRTLFATRLGKKVFFSAELQNLAHLPGLSRAVDHQALADYLSLSYIPAPKTLFRDILEIPAGHITAFAKDGTVTHTPFWRPRFYQEGDPIPTWEEACHHCEELIHQALQRGFHGKRSMGIMLSGGIDSGTLLGMVRKYFPELPLHAFTVSFLQSAYDESALARKAADKAQVPFSVVQATARDFSRMTALTQRAAEPFGDSSLLACALCMSHPDAKDLPLLTGDGGDELFGGYRRYQAMLYRHRVPLLLEPLSRALATLVRLPLPSSRDNRSTLGTLSRALDIFAKSPLRAYATFQQTTSDAWRNDILRDPVTPPYLEQWKKDLREVATPDVLDRYNLLDLLHYLPDDGCRKQTIAASASSIELSAPLMDRDLADFALSLPPDYRATTSETKRLLRAIGSPFLPQETLNTPKRGFGIPLADWFRGPLQKKLLKMVDSHSEWDTHGLLNQKTLQKAALQHIQEKANHAPLLWAAYCLMLWEQEFPA